MHITSLPDGQLGADAFRFVDWLADAGQSWWQMLPLGPPDRYRSPYKSRSAFAAWPGLLSSAARRAPVSASELLDFRERNAFWIDDWARFGGRDAVADQVRFDREWGRLRAYASAAGVRLFGDVAIYVAPQQRGPPRPSGAVPGWRRRRHATGLVLGDRPAVGQPAVRLARAATAPAIAGGSSGCARTLALYDFARLDHFRGFVAYWAVPAGDRTALGGRWVRGPGTGAVRCVRSRSSGTCPWSRRISA